MKLEFRLPISPKPAFYAQVRLIALSLARLGGVYAQARIQVCVGDQPTLDEVRLQNRWAEGFPVDWYVVTDDEYARIPDPRMASGHGRYTCPSDADIVVLCDADTCTVGPMDELLAQLAIHAPTVAGLQAHYSPFKQSNDATWRDLLQAIGRPDAPLAHRYSMDLSGDFVAPAYFNYGFVAFNAAAFQRVADSIDVHLHTACRLLPGNPFAAQVALALAVIDGNVETIALGHEYNCANDDLLLTHALVDPDDVRVIHYLRGHDLQRHEFLRDRAMYDAFLATERANAINERLRRHLLTLPDAFAGEAIA